MYQKYIWITPIHLKNNFLKPLSASSPDGPLSCHLRHTDESDDKPDIYWNGEDCPEVLVQQGEEPSLATRWHQTPSASLRITSLTHVVKSLKQWFINEFRKACRRGCFLSLHDSIILFWAACLQEASQCILILCTTCSPLTAADVFCCSLEGCSSTKSFGLLWRTSPLWPPGPSGISLLVSHKWPPSSTWSG